MQILIPPDNRPYLSYNIIIVYMYKYIHIYTYILYIHVNIVFMYGLIYNVCTIFNCSGQLRIHFLVSASLAPRGEIFVSGWGKGGGK